VVYKIIYNNIYKFFFHRNFMTLIDKIKKIGVAGAVGLASLLATGEKADANVIIKSVPAETEWVADGETEYRLDVYGDTTAPDVYDKQIESAGWDVKFPTGLFDYLTITRAELPDPVNNPSENPEDFFYGFYMFSTYNFVASHPLYPGEIFIHDGDELGNSRIVAAREGPTNVSNGLLGSYWFVVSQDAPLGEHNFTLNNVRFYDTDENSEGYKLSNHNLTIQNIPFTIVAPPSLEGDANGDGKVNILDLIYVRNRLGQDPESGDNSTADANNDGKINVLDLIYVRNRLGNSYN